MKIVKIKSLTGNNTDAIIFDLGGVLLNLDFKRSLDAFTGLGFGNVEKEMSRLLYANPAGEKESLFHRYEKGLIGSGQFRAELRKHTEMEITDDQIDRAWTAMLLDLHEENMKIIETLRGSYRLFLLSNTNAIHIDTLHDRKDKGEGFAWLTRLFEKVYYSHEVKMRKPDREIFDHVILDAGVRPENTLFIDDSIYNVEAAKKAGLQACHHKAGESLRAVFEIQ